MAAQIRRSQSRMVGIVVSDLSQPFFSHVLQACEAELGKAGYQTLLFNSFENPEKEMNAVKQLVSLNAAGCIMDLSQNSKDSIPFLRKHRMPFVLFGRRFSEVEDYYVVPDNRAVGYDATRHLLECLPERPVLCVNGPNGISPTTERYERYVRAKREARREVDQRFVFHNCFGMDDGYNAGLMAAERVPAPFSVFCSTDRIAAGFLRALYERNLRVPDDAAIVGVDDIAEARFMIPALSTVALPKKQMAEESACMLMELVNGKQIDNPRIQLPGKLIIRESSSFPGSISVMREHEK
jgi:LacI family transcriptional regulator